MMVKIFIDPGHGGSDPGAQGNGILEKNITLDIANRIRDILLNEFAGVEVRMSRSSDTTVSLAQRTSSANSWGANYFLSIHINAGGGTGFESYIYPSASAQTNRYQDIIHPEIVSLSGFKNRGKKGANFHVLRETNMSALLTENGFVDNVTDANNLRSASFREKIARGHVNGLAKAFNLKRKSASNPNPSPDKLYRVQIGAFKDKNNAEQFAIRAKARGFSTYVHEEGGYYKVQIGAFSDRKNAESLEFEAKRKGFEVVVVED